MENVVAQMLRTAGQGLFFHFNSGNGQSGSRMEIDFLLSKSRVSARHNIYPVEVKSANDYSTTSLDRFKKKYASSIAHSIILHPGDASFGKDMVRLPLYMASLIPSMGA